MKTVHKHDVRPALIALEKQALINMQATRRAFGKAARRNVSNAVAGMAHDVIADEAFYAELEGVAVHCAKQSAPEMAKLLDEHIDRMRRELLDETTHQESTSRFHNAMAASQRKGKIEVLRRLTDIANSSNPVVRSATHK